MKLFWESLSRNHGGKPGDCFADTPRDASITYGNGRWLVKKVRRYGSRVSVYELKFSGDYIAYHATADAAKADAEQRTGG